MPTGMLNTFWIRIIKKISVDSGNIDEGYLWIYRGSIWLLQNLPKIFLILDQD